MPDGTIVTNVPDNITQSDLLARYSKSQQPMSITDRAKSAWSSTWGSAKEASPEQQEIVDRMSQEIPGSLTSTDTGTGRTAGEVGRENLPMIGATMAAALVPPIALPVWALRLGLAGKAIAPVVTNSPKIAAAGAGGGAGGATREAMRDPTLSDLVTGREPPSVGSVLREGADSAVEMALTETAGGYAGALLSKLLAPGAKSMTPESKEALELAKKYNLPVNPESVATSLPAKLAEGTLERFAPSKLVNDAYRKKAIQTFNRAAVELPEKEGVGAVIGNAELTKKVMGSLDEILEGTGKVKGLKSAAKESREAFIASLGDKLVPITNTAETLRKVKVDAVDTGLREFVQTKLQAMGRAKSLSAESVDTMMSQLGSLKVKTRADEKFLTQIRNAIKEDFRAAGADMAKLDESAKQFSESFGVLKGSAAKQLKAMMAKGEEPTFLTEKLYREESANLLSSLKARLPKETAQSLDAQNLTNIIMNSTKEGPMPGLRVLDGAKLEKIIKANIGVLKRNYSASTVESMQNLAKLAKASASNMAEFKGGLTKGEQALQWAGLATAAKFEPVTTVVSSASAMALANSMMRPSGWANKWLTTGIPGAEVATEGLKLGGRAVFDD